MKTQTSHLRHLSHQHITLKKQRSYQNEHYTSPPFPQRPNVPRELTIHALKHARLPLLSRLRVPVNFPRHHLHVVAVLRHHSLHPHRLPHPIDSFPALHTLLRYIV
jgi:hypothetical protein